MSASTLTRHVPSTTNLTRRLKSREFVLFLLLVAEIVVLSQLSPYFLAVDNLLQVARYASETGIVALGMLMIIITGGIDLSVGSALAMVAIVIGFSYQGGLPMAAAILLGLVVGVLSGLFNGVLIAYLRLNPLAVTLGTYALYRGIAYAISGGHAVDALPSWFAYVGQYYLGSVPGQLIALVVLALVVSFLLRRTVFGRYVYALGTNETTSRYSGVPITRTKLLIYGSTGLLVAITALIYMSRLSSAQADSGTGLELAVIAAVALGGASIYGGVGSVSGTLLGVVMLALLQNGLTLANVASNWGQVLTGVVLILAVFVNEVFRRATA